MRLFTSAVCATITIGLLAGCAGNVGNTTPSGIGPQARNGPISVFDDAPPPPRLVSVIHSLVPDVKKKLPKTGTYVSEFYGTDLLAYHADNEKNKKPLCKVRNVASVNGVAVDGVGNLIEPDGGTATINIFAGPTLCGKNVGSISDPYGQAPMRRAPTL